MPKREKVRSIDAQWQALQPGWGLKNHKGERKMLYDLLEPGEDIELLHSCGFETRDVAWGSRHERGVVVATGRRVILLNRGRLSKNRFSMTYLEIDEITELEPGRVRLTGAGRGPDVEWVFPPIFDLDLQFASFEFSRFVRARLLGDEESVAAAFPRFLAAGERVRHWAHCSAGEETVTFSGSDDTVYQGGKWGTHWDNYSAVAAATERRILLIALAVDTDLLTDVEEEKVIASCPHGTILGVDHLAGRQVRFVDRRGDVYLALFRREADASPFVDIMQEHADEAQHGSSVNGLAVLEEHLRASRGLPPD